MNLYSVIPSDRYITREDLVFITGMGDREIRKEINELRKHADTVIVSSSRGKGYKRPSCVEELEACLNESRSRVQDEVEKQNILQKAIRIMKNRAKDEQLCFDF